MTDAEATTAIETLVRKQKAKLLNVARKNTAIRVKYTDELGDMINEALLAGWKNRDHIECMEAYVVRSLVNIATRYYMAPSLKAYTLRGSRNGEFGNVQDRVRSFQKHPESYLSRDNGDVGTAIKQWNASQRMEDLTCTIDACADRLTTQQRKHFEALVSRDGENGGENHGGSHAVEIRDSRIRRIMRKKREDLESKQKVRRAAA
jgi:ribosome-associated translation inhibitor RaiA